MAESLTSHLQGLSVNDNEWLRNLLSNGGSDFQVSYNHTLKSSAQFADTFALKIYLPWMVL
jgi:hypothetical protein